MKTVKQKMKEIRNSITNDIVNDNRFFILIYRRVIVYFNIDVKGEPENVSEWRVVMQQNQSLEITKVALDAMGGDYAPAEPVKGAVDAVNARSDIKVLLIGQEDVFVKNLKSTLIRRSRSRLYMLRKLLRQQNRR